MLLAILQVVLLQLVVLGWATLYMESMDAVRAGIRLVVACYLSVMLYLGRNWARLWVGGMSGFLFFLLIYLFATSLRDSWQHIWPVIVVVLMSMAYVSWALLFSRSVRAYLGSLDPDDPTHSAAEGSSPGSTEVGRLVERIDNQRARDRDPRVRDDS